MGNVIKAMFSSKKFLTALAGAVAAGLGIPEEALVPLVAYVVGQGIADHGKEAAKVNAPNSS